MAHSLRSSQAPSPLREETTSSQGASRAGRDKDPECCCCCSHGWMGEWKNSCRGRLSSLSSAEVCETEDRGTPSKRRREDTTTEHRVTSLASPRGKKLSTVQTQLDNRRSLVARRRASPSKNNTKYSEPTRRSERLVGQGSKETLEGPGERRGQVEVVDSSGDSGVARMVGQREDLPGAGKDPQARRSLTFNSKGPQAALPGGSQSVWEYPESYWDKIPANSAWRSTVSPTLRETRTTRIQCDERRVGGGLNEDGVSPDSVPPISPAENQTGVAVPESQRGSPNLDTSSTSGGPITNSQASEGTGKKAARRTKKKWTYI